MGAKRHIGGACALAIAAALVAAPPAAAETFPNKPIEIVIHTKYGGGTDTTARMMALVTSPVLGVPMKVIARRGGSGAKAHAYVNGKPRDGYTILALTQTHLYTIARGKSKLQIGDLVGIARAMNDPTFVAVNAKSPHKTFKSLLAASHEKPLVWSVAQIGGTEHIGLARLAAASGMKYRAVPFGSGAQMVQALMSGAIDAALPNVSEAKAQIDAGHMRPLMVLAEKRLKDFPDVPSAFELGYKVKLATTRGYAVLKGTPPERVAALSKALVAGMKSPRFAAYLKASGLTVEESVAGQKVWTANLREEYGIAAEALRKLGLIK
jgi:putative tricarboxylic transport membrane protein